jgi:hypothetical protein
MSAELFAHGIPPDITSYVFNAIRWPKDMVVVAHFPKSDAAQFAERKRSALFEEANEFAQVAPVMDAFRKDMNMIGHHAKRMQTKPAVSSTFQQ